jgi:hypothetical protein
MIVLVTTSSSTRTIRTTWHSLHLGSNIVAHCISHGASTTPLTKHRTSFLRVHNRDHTTNPSRRWQPPGVTSTTSLQLDHLMPILAISQYNTLLTHNWMQSLCAQVIEGSKALSSKDTKSPRCSATSQSHPRELLKATKSERAVVHFTQPTGHRTEPKHHHQTIVQLFDAFDKCHVALAV